MQLGVEESYRQGVDGPVKTSAVLMFDPPTPKKTRAVRQNFGGFVGAMVAADAKTHTHQ
jgi:hypothetical protein